MFWLWLIEVHELFYSKNRKITLHWNYSIFQLWLLYPWSEIFMMHSSFNKQRITANILNVLWTMIAFLFMITLYLAQYSSPQDCLKCINLFCPMRNCINSSLNNPFHHQITYPPLSTCDYLMHLFYKHKLVVYRIDLVQNIWDCA